MYPDDYEKRSREAASDAISKGHVDAENLRELLIWTTSGTTEPMVSEYFSRHLDDEQLLSALFKIALEGEDSGDAPWAAPISSPSSRPLYSRGISRNCTLSLTSNGIT